MNWPNEPPALITPEAVPRDSNGKRCAAAPISTEKLPAPEPMEARMPRAIARPKPLSMNGVMAQPMASVTKAATSTSRGTVAVGNSAGDRLDGAPGELPDRQRQADGGDAHAGRAIDGADEQSKGLAGSHGHHENTGRCQGYGQHIGASNRVEHHSQHIK